MRMEVDNRVVSLPLEEKDGKVKILCPCCCHQDGCHHIMPCCDGGYKWVDKEQLENELKDIL